jgi:uncharacterized protein (DUF2344 family)
MRTESEIRDKIDQIKQQVMKREVLAKQTEVLEEKKEHINTAIQKHEQLIALWWVLGVEWLP